MGSRQKKTGYVISKRAVSADELAYEVQADYVVVAFHRVELDGETTRVAGFVSVLTTRRNSAEADEDRRLLTDARQKISFLVKC